MTHGNHWIENFLQHPPPAKNARLSPFPPRLQALPPPLRRKALRDPAKLPRYGTAPAPARAPYEPRAAFPALASRSYGVASLSFRSSAEASSLLPQHQSKPAAGDAASTSGDDSGPGALRCGTATSSANFPAGIRESRERRARKLPGSRRQHRRDPTRSRTRG